MGWFRTAVSITIIGVFIPILALAAESKTPVGDLEAISRWGRVDFTQYCGRTVGELIDTLGNDFDEFYFDEEPAGFLNSCTFVYNDGEIRISPATFAYCHRDRIEGPWAVDEFKKETIGHIQMEISAPKDGAVRKLETKTAGGPNFAFDYLSYIGGTIDSLLKDVGYACQASWADTGAGCYFGCWFIYPNDVTIQATLETFMPIPDTTTAINMINDYVLQQRIGTLTIYCCKRGGAIITNKGKVNSPED